jgi:murein DD-endopeptidase MepM/ murein hydrolase activator NlpD
MVSSPKQLLSGSVQFVLGKHDDDYPYLLPYLRGRAFPVIQAYGGAFSHFGKMHFSIDFGMPLGTPVCAARPGRVVRIIDTFDEGGADRSFIDKCNIVEIQHTDRSTASYVHLAAKSVLVRLNQDVHAREVIAFSGNTGWSSRPHLHFHCATQGSRIATRFATHRGDLHYLEQGHWYVHQSPVALIALFQRTLPRLTESSVILRQRPLTRLRRTLQRGSLTSKSQIAAG